MNEIKNLLSLVLSLNICVEIHLLETAHFQSIYFNVSRVSMHYMKYETYEMKYEIETL